MNDNIGCTSDVMKAGNLDHFCYEQPEKDFNDGKLKVQLDKFNPVFSKSGNWVEISTEEALQSEILDGQCEDKWPLSSRFHNDLIAALPHLGKRRK